MRSNAVLLALVLVVAAVTGLNHYSTRSNLAYFQDTIQYDNRQLAMIKATEDAQVFANNLAVAVKITAEDSQRWQKNFAAVVNAAKFQAAYIKLLEAKLVENKIELPPPPQAHPTRPQASPAPRPNST